MKKVIFNIVFFGLGAFTVVAICAYKEHNVSVEEIPSSQVNLYKAEKTKNSTAVEIAKEYIYAWNKRDFDMLTKLGRYGYQTSSFQRSYAECLVTKDAKQLIIKNLTKIRQEIEPDFKYKVGYHHSIINKSEGAIRKKIYNFIRMKKYTKADFEEFKTPFTDKHDLKYTRKAVDVGDFIIKSILGDNYQTNLTSDEYQMVCLYMGSRYVKNGDVHDYNEIFRHKHQSTDPKLFSLKESCLEGAIKTRDIDHINFIEEKKPAPDKSVVRLELMLEDNTSYKLSIELSLVDGKWFFVNSDRWLPSYK